MNKVSQIAVAIVEGHELSRAQIDNLPSELISVPCEKKPVPSAPGLR